MSSLKLKVPPPVLTIIAALSMWLLSALMPTESELQFRIPVISILACVGLFFSASGILSFKKAETTVNPMTPNKASSLVIVGIYKITRNPMYVGLLFFLIAWSVFLWSLPSAFILIVFVIYITEFQIKPEEEALISLFGEAYVSYKKSVRRWL